MSNPTDVLTEIAKIGNYAIPAFGAFLTAALSVGSFYKGVPEGRAIVINFALYTVAATWVAYAHRLAWLRHRRTQQEGGEKSSNLPTWAVCIFMLIHLVLIVTLCWRLWPLGTL